ncbi:MAG: DNA alkylation repair protein, partial [Anaerolineae bacterium]|nr:DNA alkylation repair protein [Anaerolineae bacterium]
MPELLKNMYNLQVIAAFASAVKAEYPPLDENDFVAAVMDDGWEGRELKQRMRHLSITLRAFLPDDYRAALEILRRAAPCLEGFVTMTFPDFVELYGLEDWEVSLPALEQFTQQSSAEYAVRPFILREPERMMQQMKAWAQHKSPHVRRLASEGCRPRLPWAMALPIFKRDPAPILPILELLKNDESEYVRRSVSNNLNDISKDNPQVVIETVRRWQQDDSPEMQKLIHHALRTLVKAGHPDALALLGANHHDLN